MEIDGGLNIDEEELWLKKEKEKCGNVGALFEKMLVEMGNTEHCR